MSTYIPDRWVILDLNLVEVGLYKVLGGWMGGYLDPDYWRTSSGITSIVKDGDCFVITNYSGSRYRCNKGREGLTALSGKIYSDLKDKVDVEIVEDITGLMDQLNVE